MDKANAMIQELTTSIDAEINKIIEELEGRKIKDIRRLLRESAYELNPTKRKLIEIIEEQLSSKINEQSLTS